MSNERCRICFDARASEIDAALLQGQMLKSVAAQFGLSEHSLSRHRRNHLLPPNVSATDLEGQAALWLARADSLYAAAVADGDLRAQAQSLTVAFRALELRSKQEQKAAEAETVRSESQDSTGRAPAAVIEYLDKLMAEHADLIDRSLAEQKEKQEKSNVPAVN